MKRLIRVGCFLLPSAATLMAALLLGIKDVWLVAYLVLLCTLFEARLWLPCRSLPVAWRVCAGDARDPIRVEAGHPIQFHVEVRFPWTHRLLPISCSLFSANHSGADSQWAVSAWVGWRGVVRLTMEVDAVRGRLQPSLQDVTFYGWFGVEARVRLEGAAGPAVLIHPQRFEMDGIFLTPAWRWFQRTSALSNLDVVSIGVRPYRAGDKLTHIHWGTTVKWDEIYVREWGEGTLPIYITLDTVGAHYQDRATLEWAISLCAALVEGLMARGIPLRATIGRHVFAMHGGNDRNRTTAHVGFLDTLSMIGPERHEARPAAPRGGFPVAPTIYISPVSSLPMTGVGPSGARHLRLVPVVPHAELSDSLAEDLDQNAVIALYPPHGSQRAVFYSSQTRSFPW